jgi:lipopolysaccharide export system protein LptA
MRYILIGLFLILNIAIAKTQNVEITSKSFEADEMKHISKFIGDVKVVKGYDTITADKLTINFDKDKNPTEYIATGNAKFKLILNKKHYSGKANKIIYDPIKKLYHFIGNAFLQDLDSNKKIYGDDIQIDQLNGKYDVKSDGKKPVKFIFKVKDNKK